MFCPITIGNRIFYPDMVTTKWLRWRVDGERQRDQDWIDLGVGAIYKMTYDATLDILIVNDGAAHVLDVSTHQMNFRVVHPERNLSEEPIITNIEVPAARYGDGDSIPYVEPGPGLWGMGLHGEPISFRVWCAVWLAARFRRLSDDVSALGLRWSQRK